jgi:hypothetical protein
MLCNQIRVDPMQTEEIIVLKCRRMSGNTSIDASSVTTLAQTSSAHLATMGCWDDPIGDIPASRLY